MLDTKKSTIVPRFILAFCLIVLSLTQVLSLSISQTVFSAEESPEAIADEAKPSATKQKNESKSESKSEPNATGQDAQGPCITEPGKKPTVVEGEKPVKVDAASLLNIDLKKTPWFSERVGLTPSHPAFSRPRMIWADSIRFIPIKEVVGGDIVVERWINEPPKELAGKYVLVEVWATWCPPCRRGLPLLNYYHEKYKDQLAVVAICETDENALKEMKEPIKLDEIRFPLAIDTNRRFANKLGVYGIPHAVILEPVSGAVIWEGMPTLPGYELDETKIEKILAIGKKLKEAGKIPDKSAFSFVTEKADPDKTPKHQSGQASW